MNSSPLNAESGNLIKVRWSDRWTVYRRLQELEIPCHCAPDEPLQVEFSHPLAGIQLWSVVKQTTESRSALLNWLNQCWQLQD